MLNLYRFNSESTVGDVEKKLNLPPGSFRNKDTNRDTRSDKKLDTCRREAKNNK